MSEHNQKQHLHIENEGEQGHAHGHIHGVVDPSLLSSQRGIWAVKWSLVGLFATAILQVVIVGYTGSVALLADTIHNFGDALTAIPLWIAFQVGKRQPTRRFTYGYGRLEDLAGLFILLMITISAFLAGYESIRRFFNPRDVQYIWAVVLAAMIGFAGNEAVAIFRIRVGNEIGSAALIADGYHARVDGLTSLAVLAGAVGIWLGFPLADPIAGLVISLAIFRILWGSAKSIFTRMLDGVDPKIVDEIEHAVMHVPGVEQVTDVRVRWLGHRLHAELNLAVNSDFSVSEGHSTACQARHELVHHLPFLSDATIHIDPLHASGNTFHGCEDHVHDGLPSHSHN
jgi:cation diffusion facilitator family transporter